MAKDDKLKFKGVFVEDDLEKQAIEFGENHKLEMEEAKARMENPAMAAAQQSAYDAALEDMLALKPTEVRWPIYDPRLLLDEALNYAENVVTRRRTLQAKVGDKLRVDLMLSLERYALATMHAFKLHRSNPAPPESLPRLVHEGASRRYRLALACSLAFRGKARTYAMLNEIDGSTVPEAIAYDIFRMRRTLLGADPKTNGPWFAHHEELGHAEQLANTLLQAATNPSLSAALAWPTADMYARAYTLVHRACYEAELGLLELDNAKRHQDDQYGPLCIFCDREATTLLSLHKNFPWE